MSYETIEITANTDLDNCLEGAVDEYVSEHPEAAGYDLCPRWADDELRDTVLLDVPVEAA